MKSSYCIIGIFLSVFFLSSCISHQNIWTDDVYHMRSAELPEGESLVDETGYANFKERTESQQINSYYEPRTNVGTSSFYDSYDPIFWGMYPLNYYPSTTLFFGQGIPGFNNEMSWYGNYGYPFYSSYYGYDPFYNIYGYNSFYGNFNQGYGNFNNIWGMNGYNGNNNQNGNAPNSAPQGNYHEGPRGSLAGYTNSANRLGISTIKSAETNNLYRNNERPKVIESFILSEESNYGNNFNYDSNFEGRYTNDNFIRNDYKPREQRTQPISNIPFENNYQHTNTNFGSFQLKETNRVNVPTSPTRIDNVQPARGNGAVRQAPSGRRN